MIAEPYIDKLVADSAAFLRNVPLHQMARQVVTCPQVVDEIRDKPTRMRLQVLPYELQLKDPSDQAIRQVSEFARETGNLRFLSATDVRVLALTLQVTRETLGDAHLRLQPAKQLSEVTFYHPKTERVGTLPVGFVSGDAPACVADRMAALAVGDGSTRDDDDGWVDAAQDAEEGQDVSDDVVHLVDDHEGEQTVPGDADDPHSEEMHDARETQSDEGRTSADEVTDEDESEDDDDSWITPANIQEAKREMNSRAGEVNEPVKVACMTTDFTMQNVLKQMNLEMVSVEGRRIREVRHFVLRCFGCFQITPDMEKKFCPRCGNSTLKRVAVTLRPDGTQQIHISTRKPISKRGTKFSLPLPRGGKYSVAPVLCADQSRPLQRATDRSKAPNAILSEDFVSGGSPFSFNDVNSRAAQLGRSGQHRHTPNWERRNPNARAPPTGNKKKRRK